MKTTRARPTRQNRRKYFANDMDRAWETEA